MSKLVLVALVGCRGVAARDEPAASPPVELARSTVPDAVVPPDAAPVRMLPADRDPWGPNAPRLPDPPRSKRPPAPAGEMPEPADRDFVLRWQDRPRVRVHMPVGNWYENRPIVIGGGASHFTDIKFHPSWGEGNIDLVLDLGCQDDCDRALPATIVERARDSFAAVRDAKLTPRWIARPQEVDGVWSWRFEATDDVGTRTDGRVAVFRIIPELGTFLECRGETTHRANPVWLDRLEALCRDLSFEILP